MPRQQNRCGSYQAKTEARQIQQARGFRHRGTCLGVQLELGAGLPARRVRNPELVVINVSHASIDLEGGRSPHEHDKLTIRRQMRIRIEAR